MTAQNTTITDYPNAGTGIPQATGVVANHVDPYGRAVRGELALVPNTQSVTAALTLLAGCPAVQLLTPTAARTVTLPPVAGVCTMWIYNLATTAGRILTIVDAAAALVATVDVGQSVMLVSDGATWVARYESGGAAPSAPAGLRAYRGNGAPASIATAGAGSPSAANLLTGTVVRDCAGASRTDTLPTAALLVAAYKAIFPDMAIGDSMDVEYSNGSDPVTEIITIAEGSGGGWDTNQTAVSRTILGTSSRMLRIRFTGVALSSEAYVVYM